MDISHNIQFSRKKYFIYGITFLLILTNFLYIKIPSFQKTILLNTSLSFSTFTLTSTTTSTTSTTDINEVLCNNISNNYPHDLNISHNPCEPIRCIVITRNSGGRLGNRMFIFASAYGLARTHGCHLHVSNRIMAELSNNFNISVKEDIWLTEEQIVNINDFIIKDTVCSFLPDMLRPNAFKHIELRGYWQSYLYFDAYRDEIRQIYIGRSDTLLRLSEYFYNITKTSCQKCFIPPFTSHDKLREFIRSYYNITWIGIHIRRQDFRVLGYVSDENYIYHAIDYYKRRYYNHKIRFLVTSDDKIYCEQLFTKEQKFNQIFILPEYFTHADDLIALSFAHHSIITGGTYGFWAGYLAGGEVLHDIKYQVECSRSDYYPSWFKLVGKTKSKSQII